MSRTTELPELPELRQETQNIRLEKAVDSTDQAHDVYSET